MIVLQLHNHLWKEKLSNQPEVTSRTRIWSQVFGGSDLYAPCLCQDTEFSTEFSSGLIDSHLKPLFYKQNKKLCRERKLYHARSCKLMQVMLLGLTVFPARVLDYLMTTQLQAWETPSWVVGQRSPRDSLNNMGYCYCPWLLSKGCKSLLLKTPCALGTGLRRIFHLHLTLKSPPLPALTATIPEGGMQAAEGEDVGMQSVED